MTEQTFDEAVSDLVASLGDATRRAIYLAVRQSENARSVADIADAFGIHSNVARYHLDHLVDAGFLRVTRSSTRAKGGRPANLYEFTKREVHLDLPSRNFELLAGLLAQVLQRVPSGDVDGIAYEVGAAYGEQLAESRQLRGGKDLSSAVDEVTDVMHSLGFRTRRDEIEVECGYLTTHCPFGTVALENPRVVCSLDRGLVAGLTGTMHKDIEVSVSPHTRLSAPCITTLTKSS
ncbi:MAG: helix-turn-helix domain-containing protein [Acidimicrobiia bacterium]